MSSSGNKKLSIEERLSLAARAKGRKKGKRLDSPSLSIPSPDAESEASELRELDNVNTTIEPEQRELGAQSDEGFEDFAAILPADYRNLSVEELLIALRPHLAQSNSTATTASSPIRQEQTDTSLVKLIKEKDSIIDELRKEGENLSKIELRHSNTIKGLRERVKTLEHKLECKNGDLEAKTVELDTLSGDFIELQSKCRESALKIELLLQERDSAESELDILRTGQLLELQQELEKARQTIKQLELQSQRLRDQLETATMKSDMKYQALEETSKGEIARLEMAFEAARIQLSQLSSNSEITTDKSYNGNDNSRLASQHKDLETQFEISRENWSSIESSLRQKILELESRLGKAEEARKFADEGQITLRDENSDYKSRLERSEHEKVRLAREIEELQRKVATLGHSLSDAEDDVKLWQEKYRVRKAELESRLSISKAQAGPESEVESAVHGEEPTSPNGRDIDKISNWELQDLQNLGTSFVGNEEVASIKSQYDLEELLPSEAGDLPGSLRKSSIASFDYTPSQQQRNTLQNHQNTQMNAQMIGRLGAQIRRLETELASLQESHQKLLKEKQTVNDTIFKLMEENERVAEIKDQLKTSSERGKSLEEELNNTAQALADRAERVEELENDVNDLKELLQMQFQQLVELQELVR
ncbi:LANO_0B01024g1_1 [Lachancea nothofagi CBS 11611]|uniref:LANO_0B01024g1_1 n=1 Tax=Lachancea nothofagi CBS 11611 TaxID=1266666 RepID=A0A1G4IUM5_9SACH|nr:LANO_0B01024g1_1 [Lachancea nothofagi CBS 11611]